MANIKLKMEFENVTLKGIIIFQRRITQNTSFIHFFIISLSLYQYMSIEKYSFQKV